MVKKFSVFLLIALIYSGILSAQTPPPPVLGVNEHYTNLWSVSYDYQTNGSVRYLIQDPANKSKWCAIIMSQQDSANAAGVGRYVYYAYSEDNGNTWTADVLSNTAANGFPCITLSNGLPVISRHVSSAAGCIVSRDLFFGAFGWADVGTIPPITGAAQPIWPHITGTANGNLVNVAAPNATGAFDGQFTTYNGSTWSNYSLLPNISGPSGNFDAAANTNGRACILGIEYNLSTLAMSLFTSNDNGGTFTGSVIFNTLIIGSDTLYTNLYGYQATYIGDEPHIAMVVYNNTATVFPNANTVEYIRPSIYHWSASTGLDVIANGSNIPNLADTITTALMNPLTQPTITRTASGKLMCAYTAFLNGNTQVVQNGDVVNAGEILVSVSNDNGNTWSNPTNITNTPNVEEKHPSFAQYTNSDSLRIYYIRDMKAGGWVNVADWGKAPVYGIFYSGPAPVGIREDVSIAKTYELFQNYPNPFNPTTTISYFVQKTGMVTLKVFDALGREVETLVNEIQTQGPREITFNGDRLSSGIYYYSITAGDFTDTKKMMLIK